MTENLIPKQFTNMDIDDLENEITEQNWALRALGALISTADLGTDFGNEWKNASEYRYGLKIIIDTCIEKQEQKLKQLRLKYNQSPESIIEETAFTYEMVSAGGCRTHENALDTIRKAVKKLNAVIIAFDDEYPRAKKLKTNFVALEGTFSGSGQRAEHNPKIISDKHAETKLAKAG